MEEIQRRRSCKTLPFFIFLMLSFFGPIESLSVTGNDFECVYEYVLYEGDTVSGNFVVVDHDIFWSYDHPGIDFTVTSPGGNTVHTQKGTSGDKFQFKARQSGMYKFCFHNPYSTLESVSFYIYVGHIPTEHDLVKDEHLDPINIKIAELREALESVTAEQKYLKARDTRHRHTNESTRKRAVFYTIGEYLLLALGSHPYPAPIQQVSDLQPGLNPRATSWLSSLARGLGLQFYS